MSPRLVLDPNRSINDMTPAERMALALRNGQEPQDTAATQLAAEQASNADQLAHQGQVFGVLDASQGGRLNYDVPGAMAFDQGLQNTAQTKLQNLLEALKARQQARIQEESLKRQEMQAQLERDRLNEEIHQHGAENRLRGEGIDLQVKELGHRINEEQDAKAKELGKEMEPLGAVDATLGQLEGILNSTKGQLPGVGPVRGRLPPSALSDEGKKLRSLVETVGLQGDRVISGSTGFGKSPEMAAKLQGATQLLKTGTDEGIRQGARLMRELHDAAKTNTLGAYAPEVQQRYLGRVKGGAGTAPGAPTVVEERKGASGRIIQKMSDGSHRVKPDGG